MDDDGDADAGELCQELLWANGQMVACCWKAWQHEDEHAGEGHVW